MCERTRWFVAQKYLGIFGNIFGLLHACWFLTFVVQCLRRVVGVTKVFVLVFACPWFPRGPTGDVPSWGSSDQVVGDLFMMKITKERPISHLDREEKNFHHNHDCQGRETNQFKATGT